MKKAGFLTELKTYRPCAWRTRIIENGTFRVVARAKSRKVRHPLKAKNAAIRAEPGREIAA